MNVGKEYSSPGKLSCGIPQGSILGPLLFLLYVNDMPQAVNSELLLYADDTCFIYMGKDTKTVEDVNGSLIINSVFILAKKKQNLFYLGQKGTKTIKQILTLNTVILKSNSTAR